MENLIRKYGIKEYHARNIFGQGVSILIIDTGCEKKTSHEVAFAPKEIHGLAVSSLIAPEKNTLGLVGIAPMTNVLVADVRDPTAIPIDAVLDALEKGIENNVDIISISLGTTDSYQPLERMVAQAVEKGILVFAAAGSSGNREYEYPAACEKAISVASINSAHQPSTFNTRNDAVVIFAPGEDITLPLGPNGSLEIFNGTSFATPFAAGLAALILSAKRIDGGDKRIRLTRAEMILELRSPNHLSLNCDDHTYVMEKTCTNTRVEINSIPMTFQSKSALLVIFFLCIGAFFMLKQFY